MSSSLLRRGIKSVKQLIAPDSNAELKPRERARLREQLTECAQGIGGEVSTRQRANRLSETYLKLSDRGRHDLLRLIALEFGPQPAAVELAHAAYQASIGSPAQWDAEAALRAALRSSRIRILTQLNAQPQGVKFLVDLRADLLRYLEDDPELAALDRELEARLTAWFDVGFLELQRITWGSPAVLLEKLIQYEAVHEIRSWTDLKNRLDSDRRCYAFFHPRMPLEPLIFVEVALTEQLADNVQLLLDEHAPVFDAERANTAIFYSISNTQAGLRGVSFGNFLLKRVVDDLKRDFPRLTTFATLSPLPQLARWAMGHPEELTACGIDLSFAQLACGDFSSERKLRRQQGEGLARLGARYLSMAKDAGDRPYDPVARFHLGNGARIERINAFADSSTRGLRQSFGLMVNYRYDLQDIENNVEAYVGGGIIASSATLRRQARVP
jgi:malonyl-CoA decarboxylase